MIFTTSSTDPRGLKALEALKILGYNTQVISEAQQAAANAIALFTPLNQHKLQGAKGRYLRTSSVKLRDEFTPEWARTTVFRVAIIRTEKMKAVRWSQAQIRIDGLPKALKEMADQYKLWLREGSDKFVPWGTDENDPCLKRNPTCLAAIQKWLGREEVCELRLANIIVKPSDNELQTMKLGLWDIKYTDRVIPFPAYASEQALKVIGQWQADFVKEQTWVQQKMGLPSLLVRLDCIVRDGKLVVYEVEERPAGIGISSLVNPKFEEEFYRLAQTWRPFKVVVSPLREGTDDQLWTTRMPWQESATDLVLVRAEPEEKAFYGFEPNSVSSLKAKGDKSYGEKMGLWHKVSSPDELNWNESFVLKPLQGSKLKDLEIWDPKKRPGHSAQKKVMATLQQSGQMYCQRLFPPMETGIERFPWMIFRVFFGYNCLSNKWESLGGNWNARFNLRIHGASDAIFGPTVVE